MCGVYYLLDDDLRNIEFDLYCYDQCEESELNAKESAAIALFNPKLNVSSVLQP